MLSLMKWIVEGNRGLLYVRVMRTPSAVIYGRDYVFELGRGCRLRETGADAAVIVSSGRGVHEALAAADECAARGLRVGVVDMPSIDEDLLIDLFDSGQVLCLAEQNNGFILQNLLRILYRRRADPRVASGLGRADGLGGRRGLNRVLAINTLDAAGRPRFIHSGTYEELIRAFGLTPSQIAAAIAARVAMMGVRQ